MNEEENKVKIHKSKKVSVKFSDEDIWLTQNQIAEIYKTTKQI